MCWSVGCDGCEEEEANAARRVDWYSDLGVKQTQVLVGKEVANCCLRRL